MIAAHRSARLGRVSFAVLLGLALLAASPIPPAAAQSGRTLVESRESLYNNVYVYKQGNYYEMTFGYNRRLYTESVYNSLDDRDLPVAYTRYMTATLIYAKNVHSVLEIGFGGGRTSWYLHRFLPQASVTSVELDPVVAELAHKYFGISDEPNFHVATRDGRLFLQQSKDKYDIILIDAYRGPFVPFHLLTKQFYQLVKDHLAEGGVVAQNVEPSTMLFDAALATLGAVFDNVEVYPAEGNVVVIAYSGHPMTADQLLANGKKLQQALKLKYPLTDLLAHRNTRFHI
ncbi:MAG: spermidine synthase [Stellaceae bacterium]